MKTWKERIMEAIGGRNTRGAFLWYSHDKILDAIDKNEGINTRAIYRSLTCYLQGLVKSGHVERAVKPKELSRKVQYDHKQEYLYRKTGKPFTRGLPTLKSCKNELSGSYIKAQLSHELWRIHRRLPKWFRDMMMD